MVLIRTLIFLFIILILPDWYIYQRFICKSDKRWIKICYWIPTTLLLLGIVTIAITHDFYPASMQRLSYFILIFFILIFPKLIFTLISLILTPIRKIWKGNKTGEYIALAVAAFALGELIYGATEGKQHFMVRNVTIPFKDLPQAFDGYRILQISDIHSGSWTGNAKAIQKAINICNAQHADLALFTGDMVNNLASELDEFIPILSQLRAKDGVYSVLGNHDYSTYIHWKNKRMQEKQIQDLINKENNMGWHMLINDHVILHRRNDSIAIAGVENSGNPPFPDRGDLPKTLKGCDGVFTVLMSHDPTHWNRNILPETKVQLTLSGHTHEMQFSILGFSPIMFKYKEHNGLYWNGNRALFVNVGLGYVMFPFRMGAWPEITVITLKKA
ncbi:MAG: metallophosphoesterase [Phocaeicola sp.]|uniref:metallophosphoesterase n=1 Tax=Phocaeicola sp. TaxID=2773926 RepID=UPI003FA177EC